MTTLTDMTPGEREQCRGMWCEDEDGFLFVYRGDHIGRDWLAVCAYPEDVHESYLPLDYLTLRPDLPRAWNPDGTPPTGKWETSNTTDIFLDGTGAPTGHAYSKITRRFITDWEETPND